MGIAGWGWDRNWVRQGRLTAGSQVTGLDVGQLQNDQGSAATAWQTVGTATSLEILAGGDVPWRALLLARTNLTAAATVRWRIWSAAGTLVYDSGTISAGVAPGIGQALHLLPSEVQGQRCQCDLADPTNPDGFLNVALAYAGPLTQLRRNFSYGSSLGRAAGGSDVRSRAGNRFVRADWMARRWDVQMQALAPDEVWSFVMDVDLYARRGGNVLFVPNPDSPNASREAVYGILTPSSDVTIPSKALRAWRATIEERL